MKKTLKIIWKYWIYFWGLISILVAFALIGQIIKDNRFIKKEMKPSVDYIEEFQTKNGRLPTKEEYYYWEGKEYNKLDEGENLSNASYNGKLWYYRSTTGQSNIEALEIDWDKEFTLHKWRGEWTMYYYSWSKEYDTNNYTIPLVLKEVLILLLPIFIPLIILRIWNKNKKVCFLFTNKKSSKKE